MKYHDLSVDACVLHTVSHRRKEHATDPLFRLHSEFKQTVPKSARVWHPKMRTEFLHPVSQVKITRLNDWRKAQDVLLHFFIVVYDFPFHSKNITNLLYFVNRQVRQQSRAQPVIYDFSNDVEFVGGNEPADRLTRLLPPIWSRVAAGATLGLAILFVYLARAFSDFE